MPEDVNNVQPEANADQVAPLEDIDLDSAALEAERRLAGEVPAPVEEITEEVKTEEAKSEEVKEEEILAPTPDEPQEEPTDHKERTKLGRKVAELEHNISTLLEQNKTLIDRLTTPKAEPEPEPEYLDLNTPEGLDKFLTQREQQRLQAAQKDKITYAIGYESNVKGWIEKAKETGDPDVTEIHKLITGDTPFNVRRSSDPNADFEFNLTRAEAHYYKQKAKMPAPEKKPPLENATPRAPLSVGGDSRTDLSTTTPKAIKISSEALEFAKAQGWGEDKITEILAKPLQNSFVRGRR